MMHVGEHIREALTRLGIEGPELAKQLNLSRSAIYNQLARSNPTLATLERYAVGMTAILDERGDRRRFTIESLQRGWQPEPPYNGAPAAPPSGPPSPTPNAAGLADGTLVNLPMCGNVPCGDRLLHAQPWYSVDMPLRVLGVDVRSGVTFLVRVADDSMAARGLHSGDWLVVDGDAGPSGGDLVLVWHKRETSCKIWWRDGQGLLLESAALGQPPVRVTLGDGTEVVGVVVATLRVQHPRGRTSA